MIFKIILWAFVATMIGTSSVMAAAPVTVKETASVYKGSGATVDMSIGTLNGEANELVYDAGATVSKLGWSMNNIPMVTAAAAYSPLPWLTFGLKGSMNLSQSANMYDFDFGDPTCPPLSICESHSPDTELQKAYLFDSFIKARFAEIDGIEVSALSGYKADYFRWQAFNGTSNYAAPFNDGLGISYEQWWEAPYLGVAVDGTYGRFGYSGRVIGGWSLSPHDRDQHHSRSLLFKEDFDNGRMYGADVGINYMLMDGVKATLNYQYQDWSLVKGTTTETDLTNGITETFGGHAAGARNSYQLVSLGLKVDLNKFDISGQHENTAGKTGATSTKWTGFYAGAAIGPQWQPTRWTTTAVAISPLVASTAAANLGSQGLSWHPFFGYAWGQGDYAYGFEGDFGKSTTSAYVNGIPGTNGASALAGSPDSVVAESGWDGSVRGRLGVLLSPTLQAYLTGGLAIQELNLRASCQAFATWCIADRNESASTELLGWTFGGGLDMAIAHNWFLRGEYRYSDFGNWNHTFFGNTATDAVSATVATASHRLNLGLGYMF